MKIEKQFNVTVRIRFTQEKETVYGNGVSQLLILTKETKSINAAAQQMGMSYPKALNIIKRAEKYFEQPILVKKAGGVEGGGSTFTPFGEELVSKFKMLEEDVFEYTLERAKHYFPDMLLK